MLHLACAQLIFGKVSRLAVRDRRSLPDPSPDSRDKRLSVVATPWDAGCRKAD